MVSVQIAKTVTEFIDYGMIVVIIMIIYYVVRFFMVSPPTKEERAQAEQEMQEQRDRFIGWAKSKFKEKRNKEELATRKADISVVTNNFAEIIESSDDIISSLNEGKGKVAYRRAENVDGQLKRAINNLRLLIRKYEGNQRNNIVKIVASLQTLRPFFTKNVLKKVPNKSAGSDHDAWVALVTPVIDVIHDQVQPFLGKIWKDLENFHKENTQQQAANPPSGGPQRQYNPTYTTPATTP
jgi:hypothetical protein